ncbi:hypothetical protein COT65_01160, partial [Candidatus Shapirobacteria bacterium CG09_land_8_20_14_0_10_47_13]
MSTRQKVLFCWFIGSLTVIFSPPKIFAANLLANSDFEQGVASWNLGTSTATFSATVTSKHNGNYSALLTKNGSSSWAYFYQKVSVEAEKYYKLSGWAQLNDPFINNIKLRFYWLDSAEGKISSVEKEIKTPDSSFQFLETESTVSPVNALFAEVQGYVYLDQKNPVSPALFDDLLFEEVAEPTPPPEPTATSAPEPTNTPAPTSTPKPPTSTPTLKPTIKPTATATATTSGEILGSEESSTAAFFPWEATAEAEPA